MATRTKKIPKWAIPVGIVTVAGVAYYVYKKKKANEEQPKATEQNPYLAQSFIPVTAENVAGVGAVSNYPSTGGLEEGLALINAQTENRNKIFEFLEGRERNKSEQQITAGQRQGEKEALQFEWRKTLAEMTNNLTGGGAPVGNTAEGTVTAPAPPGAVATVAPSTPPSNTPSAPNCPPDFPLYNPAPGKGCYRISRTTTKGGCLCHGYPSGQLECQQGSLKSGCHW